MKQEINENELIKKWVNEKKKKFFDKKHRQINEKWQFSILNSSNYSIVKYFLNVLPCVDFQKVYTQNYFLL